MAKIDDLVVQFEFDMTAFGRALERMRERIARDVVFDFPVHYFAPPARKPRPRKKKATEPLPEHRSIMLRRP